MLIQNGFGQKNRKFGETLKGLHFLSTGHKTINQIWAGQCEWVPFQRNCTIFIFSSLLSVNLFGLNKFICLGSIHNTPEISLRMGLNVVTAY